MANYRCRSAHSGPEPQCFTLQIKVAGPGKANLGPGNRKTRPSWPEKADSGPGNHAEAGRAAARPKNKAHLRTDCLFSFRPSTAHRRDLPGGRKIGRISPKWSQNPAGGRKIGGISPGWSQNPADGIKNGGVSPEWSQNPAGGRKIGGIPPGWSQNPADGRKNGGISPEWSQNPADGRKIGGISPEWSQNPADWRKIGGIPPGPERVAAVDDRTALAAALIPVIFPRKNPGEPIYLLRFQVFLLLFYYLCGSA